MDVEPPVVVGVDVAAARPCVAVAARGGRRLEALDWLEAPADDAGGRALLADWVHRWRPAAVAVDAPQGLRRPRAGSGDRACDAALRAAGLPVYRVPDRGQAAALGPRHWMAVGRELFALLRGRRYGYEPPPAGGSPPVLAPAPALLEVYPHASFAALLGGVPPAKGTRRGQWARVRLLRACGVAWDEFFDHDSLDALVAALTAWRFLNGQACALGDEREGLVWLPVTAAAFAAARPYRRLDGPGFAARLAALGA